jgi:catechol 2,3-dioxygenase-like lactoylglutathione lyase family enzyme
VILGLWHVSFTVSNLERSVEWYTRVLGLEYVRGQVQDNPYTRQLVGFPDARLKVAQLRIPNMTVPLSRHHIELVEYERPRGTVVPLQTNSPGVGHWAFIVDDIHAEFTRLKALGVHFKSPAPNAIAEGVNRGGYTIYFLDPDGITLELLQPPP